MQLEAEQTERRKFQAIAEPPKSKFMQLGHYTTEVDLTALGVIADVGVSPSVVPVLFVMFARFFGVNIDPATDTPDLGSRILARPLIPDVTGFNKHEWW